MRSSGARVQDAQHDFQDGPSMLSLDAISKWLPHLNAERKSDVNHMLLPSCCLLASYPAGREDEDRRPEDTWTGTTYGCHPSGTEFGYMSLASPGLLSK
eukprot:554774-Pyramimonas_sp.AAC.1